VLGGGFAMKYSAYPAYKDSGVEWLGEIPEHWKVLSVRRLAGVIEQGWSPVAEDRLASEDEWGVIKLSAVSKGLFRSEEHKVLPEDVEANKCYEIRAGDFLLTRANTPHLVGDVCVVSSTRPHLMLCDLVYRVAVDDNRISRNYLCYWFLSRAGRYQVTRDARGSSLSMVKVSQNSIRSWLVALPPLLEQQAIASFLDRETAKIDALIAKKERLIELLQEKRTAIISHAVTKGLDPTVPLKDSGVEWLGEIPAHWRVMLLKRVASVRYGLGQPPPEIPDGTPLIRATNVKSGSICEEGMLYVNPDNVPESRDAILSPGEIIVVRSGAYTGDSAIIPPEYSGAIAGYDMVLTLKKGFSPFFAWQILSAEVRELQFGFCRMRAAQPHLNAEELRETIVVIPPFPEQEAISSYIDRETTKIDALIAKIREGIEKLKLEAYRIQETFSGSINLDNTAETELQAPVIKGSGTPTARAAVPLSQVIQEFNNRYGVNLTDADKLCVEAVTERLSQNVKLKQQVQVNADKAQTTFNETAQKQMISLFRENIPGFQDFYSKTKKSKDFETALPSWMFAQFIDKVKEQYRDETRQK
jgi:type I restriction enzyme S subunit